MYRFHHYLTYYLETKYPSVSAVVYEFHDEKHGFYKKLMADIRDDIGSTNVYHYFPQLHWLSYFDPNVHEVHILCNNHLNTEILALTKYFGLQTPKLAHRENRSGSAEWNSAEG